MRQLARRPSGHMSEPEARQELAQALGEASAVAQRTQRTPGAGAHQRHLEIFRDAEGWIDAGDLELST